MRPRLSFLRQRARAFAHPPAYNLQSLPPCLRPQGQALRKQGGRLWAQPCGRLSPCKLSVLTICPSTIQICLEQIWTSEGCPQGAPHGWGASTTAMLSVAGTRWRHKSARSRFGRPQDALCAMEGAHLKSCAIIASTGEKCGLSFITLPRCFYIGANACYDLIERYFLSQDLRQHSCQIAFIFN